MRIHHITLFIQIVKKIPHTVIQSLDIKGRNGDKDQHCENPMVASIPKTEEEEEEDDDDDDDEDDDDLKACGEKIKV
jgi:hypothetical protein